MAGYFTIDLYPSSAVDSKILEVVSHDGYKKKVTITFSITSANNPVPTCTPTSIKISLDEDETEFVDVTITGNSGYTGTVYANATDGIMSAADDATFTLP